LYCVTFRVIFYLFIYACTLISFLTSRFHYTNDGYVIFFLFYLFNNSFLLSLFLVIFLGLISQCCHPGGDKIFFHCWELLFSSLLHFFHGCKLFLSLLGALYSSICGYIIIGRFNYPCCYSNELSIFFGGASSQSLRGSRPMRTAKVWIEANNIKWVDVL